MPRPIEPAELLTVDSIHVDTGLPKDTIYDLIRDPEPLGRPIGFKLGRRWFIHPDDWDALIAVRRGVGANLPAGATAAAS